MMKNNNKFFEFFDLAGYQYWTASLLPCLVGITLPFWLNPPGFYFKFFESILFLLAALICHTGFSLLHSLFGNRTTEYWTKIRLLITGFICLIVTVIIGLYLNSILQLNKNVYEHIFIFYGIGTIFTGVLYILPPFSFSSRFGGEVVLCMGLGMIPVLGIYIIQTGDLTRSVYLASLPIVAATGLWFWVTEIINRVRYKNLGSSKLSMVISLKYSARVGTVILSLLLYISLVMAVIVRSSLSPVSLIGFFSIVFIFKIVPIMWKEYDNIKQLYKAKLFSGYVHLIICTTMIISSLISVM